MRHAYGSSHSETVSGTLDAADDGTGPEKVVEMRAELSSDKLTVDVL